MYEGTLQRLREGYDMIAVDYSRHGTKFGMPLNETMESLVREVYTEVTQNLSKDEDYCLFGYSLGSIVAYEIACLLRDNGYRLPGVVYLCSMEAPHKIPDQERISTLSGDEFKKKMIEYGGIDEELLEDPLMLRIFLPVIRKDFQIHEEYDPPKRDMLNIKALVLYSTEDISEEKIRAWDDVISDVEYKCYPGGHFFIYERSEDVINEVLKRRT